jgi:tetratricopeptide (TPR) repeat protein
MSFTGTRRGTAAGQLPAQVSGRPWNRPGLPGRPGGRPIVNNQQAMINRPGNNTIVNRPVNNTVINRPTVNNIVNNITNVTNVNNNQTTVINNNYNQNVNYGNQNVVAARPWNGAYDHLHTGWHTGYWNFAYRPTTWVAGTTGLTWATATGGGFTFVNPYYNQSVVISGYDYSQPLAPSYTNASQVSGRVTEEAIRRLDAARQAFRSQQYQRSLELVESAIQLLPDDPVLHELRALNLFALGDYERAAAVIYPVLAAGPGSDWNSLSMLYPSSETYISQLRNLTQFIVANPDNVAGRFLLAYHLLVVGQPKDAYVQLQEVLLRRPGDTVARELVRALQQPS